MCNRILFIGLLSLLITAADCFRLFKHTSNKFWSLQDSNNNDVDRKELWKEISNLEREAIGILSDSSADGDKLDLAYKLLAKSVGLKQSDQFISLAGSYSSAVEKKDTKEADRLLTAMKNVGLPPHLSNLVTASPNVAESLILDVVNNSMEEVDPGSTFSDTVTEKIRVKVNSYYDKDKSEPNLGKFMFWYKVAIYNEGPEAVQVVARMWEIDKCIGDKEIVRGPGILSSQPIIAPGDVFTYQSICPLKLFPPRGKRVLGTMSGAYTMCKGNMGQHNFTVKVGKFNLILPEAVTSQSA